SSVKVTYFYDVLSRLVEARYPPTQTGGPVLIRTRTYLYQDGSENYPYVVDEFSDGTVKQSITSRMALLPNVDTPTGGRFVKSCVVKQYDGLDQHHRSKWSQASLGYDGLSREISRHITNETETNAKTISHFTVTFDDEQHQATLRNELTGANVVSTTDYYGRIIKKVTNEETIDFTYDRDMLSKVISSKNLEQILDYDSFGNVKASTLGDEGRQFASSFTWTPMGQLLKATNPDGSTITCSFLSDGTTPEILIFANPLGVNEAAAMFSNSDDAYGRPLATTLGGGGTAILSEFTIANDGMFTSNSVRRVDTELFCQDWDYNAFKQLTQYTLDSAQIKKEFKYDNASQLTQVSYGNATCNFSYDKSGNISTFVKLSFINDGWQLTTVQNPDSCIAYTLQYSTDGNRTSKTDSSGRVVDSMCYDSEGRLVKFNDRTFLYDFMGRLVKATSTSGDTTKTTIYVSDGYEVDLTSINGNITEELHTSYLIHEHRLASVSINQTTNSSVIYYYHHDHLGSVIGASDRDGMMVTYYEYDAYGKVTSTGEDVSRYKYSGKQLFGSIYDFGARFYDPDTGHFLTLDSYPTNLNRISPSSFNLYTFSRNDPINYLDPDGHEPLRWWHWLGIGLMVAGLIVLTLIPGLGVTGLTAAVMTFGGNALLGAGFTSFFTDYDSDPGSWWLQMGLGTVLGGLGGFIGPALGKGIGKGSQIAISRLLPAKITQRALQGSKVTFAGRIGAKTVGETLAGGLLGGVQEFYVSGVFGDKRGLKLLSAVGNSTLLGLQGGFVLGVVTRGLGNTAKAVRRMWQNRAATRLGNSMSLNSLDSEDYLKYFMDDLPRDIPMIHGLS
ncbi:hypothetical protein AMATHDRAFT_8406, partial [Amanita thiersii Skay4041]